MAEWKASLCELVTLSVVDPQSPFDSENGRFVANLHDVAITTGDASRT
jgi:hypothetical protein